MSHSPPSQQSLLETNACDQCYRTKQPCSKDVPHCQRCVSSSISCTYSFGKFMGKPKKSHKARRSIQRHSGDISQPKGNSSSNTDNSDSRDRNGCGVNQASPKVPQGTTLPDCVQDSGLLQPAAGTKRGSTSSACDQCYRYKVKCVREADRCQRCIANSNTCTYSSSTSNQDRGDSAEDEIAVKRYRTSAVDQRSRCNQDSSEHTRSNVKGKADEVGDLTVAHSRVITSMAPSAPEYDRPIQESTYDAHLQLGRDLHLSPRNDFADPESLIFGQEDFFRLDDPVTTTRMPGSDRNVPIPDSSNQTSSNANCLTRSSTCTCIATALSTLSNLYACSKDIFNMNSAFGSLDAVLSNARNGLVACETFSMCQHCPKSVMLMLCITILQRVATCYKLISSKDKVDSLSLSVLIGGVEFGQVESNPAIVKAIVSGEKERAGKVCDCLQGIKLPAQDNLRKDMGCWENTPGNKQGGSEVAQLLKLVRQNLR